jgi:hypothetical protein
LDNPFAKSSLSRPIFPQERKHVIGSKNSLYQFENTLDAKLTNELQSLKISHSKMFQRRLSIGHVKQLHEAPIPKLEQVSEFARYIPNYKFTTNISNDEFEILREIDEVLQMKEGSDKIDENPIEKLPYVLALPFYAAEKSFDFATDTTAIAISISFLPVKYLLNRLIN